MVFTQDRTELRRFYCQAWKRHREGRGALQPLERLIVEVIAIHPEYHALLEQEEKATEREFLPESGESNPFLHLSLHLAIREQTGCNRPPGIAEIHRQLASRVGDVHAAEHLMMECLAEMLWNAQSHGHPPDETAYLECLNRYCGSSPD